MDCNCVFQNECNHAPEFCAECAEFEPIPKTDPNDCLFISQDCEGCHWLNYCYQTKKR